MRKIFKAAALATAAISVVAVLAGPAEAATKKPVLKLLWHQEFSGKAGQSPNSKVFNYDLGGGGWATLNTKPMCKTTSKLMVQSRATS